jgi:hypothetical protein
MTDAILRAHLVKLLRGGDAHLDADVVFANVPFKLWGKRPRNAPHTLWQLLEHLRIAQWDILEFSRNRRHVSPEWPEGYWPSRAAPANEAAVEESLAAFRADRAAMQALVKRRTTDLGAKIPWGDGQTILREALVLADHNAYHLGQCLLVRQLIGAAPGS